MNAITPIEVLEKRFEVTARQRVASQAVRESEKIANASRVQEDFGKESALWSPIAEPLFTALAALRSATSGVGTQTAVATSRLSVTDPIIEDVAPTELTDPFHSTVPLSSLINDVEVAIKQQMLSLFESFERKRVALEKERDEAREAYTALREENRRFDTDASRFGVVHPITHPFASHLPQSVSISSSGRIVAADPSTLVSSNIAHTSQPASRPTTSGGAIRDRSAMALSDFSSTLNAPRAPQSSVSVMSAVLSKEGLAMQLHLACESIAAQLCAQHVRLFLFDSRHNLVQVADFPRGYDGAPTLDDSKTGHRRWGRALRTVAERNMSIVGYSLSDEELAERMGRQKNMFLSPERRKAKLATVDTGAESDGDGLPFRNAEKVRCYMCWPIRAFGSPSTVCGAIEVINKRATLDSPHQRSFSTDDEWVVHHASKTMSALLARYPFPDEVLDASRGAIPRILSGLQASNSISPLHVPEHSYTDKQQPSAVASAEAIVNMALATPLSLPVFKGVMHSIRTNPSTVESVAAMAAAHTSDANTPIHIPHLPATDTATVDFRPDPPTQLTRLDYTLDALDTMWRQEHTENRLMHEQSRYWSSRVRSLTDMTKCFTDAIAKVKHMRSVEEIQTYLRTLDLSVRTSNVPAFLSAVSEGAGGSSPPATTNSSDAQAVNRGSELSDTDRFACPTTLEVIKSRRIEPLEEGPANVRTFTLDPDAKRRQQSDIQRYVEEFTTLGDAIKKKEQEIAAGLRYSRPTQMSSIRTLPRRPSWQIEKRHEAFEEKRKREQAARVGVPPATPALESPRTRSQSEKRKAADASPLVLPERAMYLPAPPHSARTLGGGAKN